MSLPNELCQQVEESIYAEIDEHPVGSILDAPMATKAACKVFESWLEKDPAQYEVYRLRNPKAKP